MTDFKVVLEDLAALSSQYATEAVAYEGVVAKLKVAVPDSGDSTLNGVIKLLLEELAILNTTMAASLHGYAAKVKQARDAYEITDAPDKNRFLWDNMTGGIS